jgi:hypothetical protein
MDLCGCAIVAHPDTRVAHREVYPPTIRTAMGDGARPPPYIAFAFSRTSSIEPT